MTTVIVESGQDILRGHIAGFAVEKEGQRTKYSGRFANALAFLGFHEAWESLNKVRTDFYEKTREMGPVAITYQGLVGPQKSESIVKSQCVEMVLQYTTTSHLATSESASKKSFPGNHGQALALMIEADIEDVALKSGPFTSEASLLQFIEDRRAVVEAAVGSCTPIQGYRWEDEEDEAEDEAA